MTVINLTHKQWWKEKDFVFEGVSGTRYLWPTNRGVWFKDTDAKNSIFPIRLFDLTPTKKSLDENIRRLIAARLESFPDKPMHLHVIKDAHCANPCKYGLAVISSKGEVVEDMDINSVDDSFVK